MLAFIPAALVAVYIIAKIVGRVPLIWCDWIAFAIGTAVYLFMASMLAGPNNCYYAGEACGPVGAQMFSAAIGLTCTLIVGFPLLVIDLALGGAIRWTRGRFRS